MRGPGSDFCIAHQPVFATCILDTNACWTLGWAMTFEKDKLKQEDVGETGPRIPEDQYFHGLVVGVSVSVMVTNGEVGDVSLGT
jgi:hypothetical protein